MRMKKLILKLNLKTNHLNWILRNKILCRPKTDLNRIRASYEYLNIR